MFNQNQLTVVEVVDKIDFDFDSKTKNQCIHLNIYEFNVKSHKIQFFFLKKSHSVQYLTKVEGVSFHIKNFTYMM